ncbi:transposase [Rhodococcus erythropolis]|uniref:transposase n=1 Tax=Rhodococcus erythropolis TaxID=1833 RepID=UPI0039822DFB
MSSLKSLARRYQYLTAEIATLEADLEQLVVQINPGLQQTKGIGTVTAAQLLITAGGNPDRLKSEASFAALCGASPIPASSGKTTRHRLNRGGDRHANYALHQIALTRMTYDQRTRDYIQRKQQKGKGTKEILRCLKRAIAREVFTLITTPVPAVDHRHLRPLRQRTRTHPAPGRRSPGRQHRQNLTRGKRTNPRRCLPHHLRRMAPKQQFDTIGASLHGAERLSFLIRPRQPRAEEGHTRTSATLLLMVASRCCGYGRC